MPAKFPSAKRLLYTTGALTHTGWATQSAISIPKDLSILNRRGYASTDDKGVPYVYLCQIDMYRINKLTTPDGLDDVAHGQDFASAMSVQTVTNNWATKNAAIKWHQARESMWRKAGVKKSHLGTYSNAIRYNWNAANQTWNDVLDGFSNAYTGGTWDSSVFSDGIDASYQLKLVGNSIDEDSTASITELNFVASYMQSRATVPADSNLESSDVPATFNHLALLTREGFEGSIVSDDVIDNVKTGQDNPPYNAFASSDTTHDLTEEFEAGRAIMGVGGGGHATMLVEVPFGILQTRCTHYGSDGADENSPFEYAITVLDIYPMQG